MPFSPLIKEAVFLQQADGGCYRDSELVRMQRRGDCGVLSLKWDICNTVPAPQAQEMSWRRGWEEPHDRTAESVSSGCDVNLGQDDCRH